MAPSGATDLAPDLPHDNFAAGDISPSGATDRASALPCADPTTRFGALGVFTGDTLRGFTLWESVAGGRWSIHHFMKADPSIAGLSSLLVHERSRVLLAAGHEFANIEQDLGIPGLAAFKCSLRPCRFLRKYLITEGLPPGRR
jgi:hypothetical protein